MDRIVSWDGIYNARDLGGLRTATGTTAFGTFYRTARLESLTDQGWQQLYDAGVRTIVDLRNEEERIRRDVDPVIDQDALPAVTVVSCPTEDQSDPGFMEICGPYLDSPEYYWENLRRWPEKFAKVFRAMAAAEEGAIVVHCAGGRDRTGMITMMLLLLAGVEHDDIAADYELSVRAVNEYFKTLPAPNTKEAPRPEADLRPALNHRIKALRELMAGFDVERYLLDAGVSAAELETLKDRLRA
ncbi:MAG TPA: tyrosine-protein phosphatase [Arthrobacter sp.]|nr:tyrosine-protein phosphatase [Arthrobacter sp.]